MKKKTTYNNLNEFINELDKAGEVRYIDEAFSPILDISKRTDSESKSADGGKALYFRNVKGSSFPVAVNLFGSQRRIGMALGVDNLDELSARIKTYFDFNPPKTLKQAFKMLPMAFEALKFFPRSFRRGTPPCQETVLKGDRVDLSILPVLQCWPKDAGRFITLPLVITRSLKTGKRNMGMYRMQIYDKNTTGMHWHIHKDGSHFFNEYVQAGRRMPVAVAIGADPATIYAATAPMPQGMDEIIMAGFIRKKPVRMAKCLTIDLEVPAEAEFVLEGYVEPQELQREGPFGDHTGYYSLADDYPVFHVTAITHRRNPVYSTTLVGRPPMEDCYLGKATERIFLPMLQTVFPEITDYYFPWEGVFHNIVIVAIDKEYSGHALKIMSGLWGQGQMSFCKTIVIVDKQVSLQDARAALNTLLANLDITSDITITKGILDVLDHASPFPNFGSKLGIDLTERFKDEPPRNQKRTAVKQLSYETVKDLILSEISGAIACLPLSEKLTKRQPIQNAIMAVSIEKGRHRNGKAFAADILRLEVLEPYNIFILFDKDIDLDDAPLILWKLFNNVDPERDITIQEGRVVIDASIKGPEDGHFREWPEELAFI
ncbi:menaquinone biosynthesis decarboxylase [Desulfococcaceae bacterium HSG7]|nr:menaquinone biosynthesis decarboxylase [Desulfococcaceae bacterium HSG7]